MSKKSNARAEVALAMGIRQLKSAYRHDDAVMAGQALVRVARASSLFRSSNNPAENLLSLMDKGVYYEDAYHHILELDEEGRVPYANVGYIPDALREYDL